jgi:hypothetical protein
LVSSNKLELFHIYDKIKNKNTILLKQFQNPRVQDRSRSWLGKCTSIKSGGAIPAFWAQSSVLVKLFGVFTCIGNKR